jgi:hypothetical protein
MGAGATSARGGGHQRGTDPPRAAGEVPVVFGRADPKAVTTLEKDGDVLLTFFDCPADHWKHLRTSDESQLWTPVALVA